MNNTMTSLTKAELNFLARRRWAQVGVMYVLFICFMMVFLFPLLFSLVSSFKPNPLEYPPSLKTAQLNPVNWIAAGRLGRDAGGGFWTGGAIPGKEFQFSITYFATDEDLIGIPEFTIPHRKAGAGLAAVKIPTYAADYLVISEVWESKRQPYTLDEVFGTAVEFTITVSYPAESGPLLERIDRKSVV